VVALVTGAKSRAAVPSIHAFDAVGTLVAPTDFNRPYARHLPKRDRIFEESDRGKWSSDPAI